MGASVCILDKLYWSYQGNTRSLPVMPFRTLLWSAEDASICLHAGVVGTTCPANAIHLY